MATEVFKLIGRITYEGQETVEAGLQRLGGKVKQAEDALKKFGDKAKDVGGKFQAVGGTITKITAPIIAIGGAAVLSANEFEKSMAIIRAGTGATGDVLTDLGEDFKEVFKNVPQDAQATATALADLNTRTGAAGKPLQELTKQMLDLSRLTGIEAPALIANTTRVFGDWGIATEKQGETLDYLWKVSQTTGIGVDQLATKIVQFGAPLRQIGFTMEESAAMFGKWEKEGVNAELVMGGLRVALGKMAKAGEEPTKVFPKIVDSIMKAGSAGEANAIALEHFGARAGADMAAAIREGRFSIDELMETLNGSTETIAKAGEDTLTFGDKVAMMKNKIMTAIEPIGTIIMGMVDQIFPPLEQGIERLSNWFGSLSESNQKWIVILGLAAAALGPVVMAIGTMIIAVGAIATAVSAAGLVVGAWVAGIGALIAVLVASYFKFEWFRDGVNAAFQFIKEIAMVAFGAVVTFLQGKLAQIQQFWQENGAQIMQAWQNVFNFLSAVISAVMPVVLAIISMVWGNIKGLFSGAINFLLGLIKTFASLFTGDWRGLWEGIKQMLSGALQFIWNLANLMFIGRILSLIKSFAVGGFQLIVGLGKNMGSAFTSMLNGAKSIVSSGINAVTGYFRKMGENAGIIFNLLKSTGSNVFNAISRTITTIAQNIGSKVGSYFSNMARNVGNILNGIKSTASSVFNNIKSAIQNPIQTAVGFVKGQIDKLKGFFSGLKLSLPKIKLPRFSIKGSFSLNPPSVPSLGIDWYKKGGVFGGPSVIGVGEEPGVSEAVIPLKKSVLQQIGEGIAAAGGSGGGSGNMQPLLVQLVMPDMRILAEQLIDPLDKELNRQKTTYKRFEGDAYL